jgi:dCMP deaminase
MKKILLAYVPVLHEGYHLFFERHRHDAELYILGSDVISDFSHLVKEIRQLDPTLIASAIRSWDIFCRVEIADKKVLERLAQTEGVFVMPKEDVMIALRERYFERREAMFDPVFLRWDKYNSVTLSEIVQDACISSNDLHECIKKVAEEELQKSSDWWRRVGCVVFRGTEIVIAQHNRHLPSEHTPYINGDPRNNFHKGMHADLGTSIHAEALTVAQAAKAGVSLLGCDMYVTTFPCPPCAKLVASAGIKRLFFRSGYGVLDGESVLRSFGVEIVRVVDK